MDTAKLSQIKKALSGQQDDGQDVARLRTGVISAVNTNGTVDVTLSGVTVAGVSYLADAGVAVGAIVQMLSYRGSLLVLGTSAGSTQAFSTLYDEVETNQTVTTTAGTAFMDVTLPGAGKYAFDVMWIYTMSGAVGIPGFALGGTVTPTSFSWASQTTHYNSATASQGFQITGTTFPTNVDPLVNSNFTNTTGFSASFVKGRVTVSDGGRLDFRLGKSTGTGNTINLKTSSCVTVTRVS